jgi:hypothetical protein
VRPAEQPDERRCVECGSTAANCRNLRWLSIRDCCQRCQHPAPEEVARPCLGVTASGSVAARASRHPSRCPRATRWPVRLSTADCARRRCSVGDLPRRQPTNARRHEPHRPRRQRHDLAGGCAGLHGRIEGPERVFSLSSSRRSDLRRRADPGPGRPLFRPRGPGRRTLSVVDVAYLGQGRGGATVSLPRADSRFSTPRKACRP